MSSAAAPAAQADLAEAHRLALAKLREMGMEIAQQLHAQSKDADADLGDVASRFAQVARAVRHTIALEARLAEQVRRLAAEQAASSADGRRAPSVTDVALDYERSKRAEERQRRAENKLEAMTLVRRAMDKAPGLDREALENEFNERLEDDPYDRLFDPDHDLAGTIRGICRDLGLSPDWGGFSNLDWRQISRETRVALTGEPLSAVPHPLYQRFPPHPLYQRFPPHTLPARTMPERLNNGTGQKFRPFIAGGAAPPEPPPVEPSIFDPKPPPGTSGYNPPDPWPRGPP